MRQEAGGFDLRVLGTVDVYNGHRLAVGGPNQRRILAALATRAGEVVTLDQLLDITWPNDPPEQAEHNLRTYVSRLRSGLGDDIANRLETRPPGYVLHLRDGELDADRFETAASRAARHCQNHDWQRSLECADDALAMWRGRPYGEFADELWVHPEVARLYEVRAALLEARCEALLGVGRAAAALTDAEALIGEYPLREGPRRLQMLALYRSGRQAEALRAFQDFRAYLRDEAGLSPSDDLVEIDRTVATGELPIDPGGGAVRGYETRELIGVGAFAEVYRGTQSALQRDVAIKAIRAELANQPEFIRGFEAEAATVAHLEHPYIVPLYDFWREPDRAFLVMRWLDGGSVEQSLDDGAWSVERVMQLVEQVGAALAVAHRSGVVHRDVKPANIFLDDLGNTYLGDFGIALEAADQLDPRAALSQGSPAYASPEQLRRQPVGPAADVHGLGITVFELLAGRLPFPDAADNAELLQHQLHDSIPRLSDLRADLPAAIDDVMATATAKDDADRYQSVEDFVRAFADALATKPEISADARQLVRRITEVSHLVENPYHGLRAFGERDTETFRGRERLVAELLDRLATQPRMLALIGASGSGKSSVVRAGIVPALRAGRVADSESWFVTTMSPGPQPYEALETALLRVAVNPPASLLGQLRADRRGVLRGVRRIVPDEDSVLLLVIDQFEELFTLSEDSERRRFLEALTTAATDPSSPLRMIVTLRADFYDHPLQYPGFAELIKQHGVTLTPLAADELERAIVEPAALAGAEFEPGLVAEIAADVASQPGAMPLMQYALTELFERRVAGVMTTEVYRELGGLVGALGRRADEIYEACTPAEQTAARNLFVRLVTFGEGSEDTRRRVHRSELGESAEMRTVVGRYGDARLLTFDHDPATHEPTVEVAHEALIREWPRLRGWLDENRAGLRVHRHLTVSAAAWHAGGRDDDELYRGARLHAAEEWASIGHDLNELERDFLDASLERRAEDERTEQEFLALQVRQNRRLRRSLASVAVVAVVALLAGAVALQQRFRANDKAAAASAAAFDSETRRISSDAVQLVTTDRRTALLLAAEAYRRDPTIETLGALQQVLVGTEELIGFVGGDDRYETVEWIDDERLVAADAAGLAVYTTEGALVGRIDYPGIVEIDAAGELVAAATDGAVVLFDLREPDAAPLLHATDALVQAVAFSPDGSSLVAGNRTGQMTLLDARDLSVLGTIDAHPEQTLAELGLAAEVGEATQHLPGSAQRGVLAADYDDSGQWIATTGWGFSRVWDAADLELQSEAPLVRRIEGQSSVATGDAVWIRTNADNTPELVTSGRFGLHRHRLENGAEIFFGEYADRFAGGASSLGTSSSAAFATGVVATNLTGGDVEIRSLDDAGRERVASPQLPATLDLAVSPDESRLAVSGDDGIAILSLNGDRLLARAFPLDESADLGVSPDGTIASAAFPRGGRPAEVWRLGDRGSEQVPIVGPEAEFVFNNGAAIVLAWREGPDGSEYRVLDARTGRQGEPFSGPFGTPSVAAFSRDQTLVAIASQDGELTVHRVADGAQIVGPDDLAGMGGALIRSVAFDPSNRFLGAANEVGAAVVWDLETSDTTRIASSGIGNIGFGPDGVAATVTTDGLITLRELPSLQPTGPALGSASSGRVFTYGPFFTDDGRFVITTADGSGRIWDRATRLQVGGVFPADDGWIPNASVNGRWLITHVDDHALRWNLDPDAWPGLACGAAGRNMTEQEWRQFGPSDSPYVATCERYHDPTTTEGASDE